MNIKQFILVIFWTVIADICAYYMHILLPAYSLPSEKWAQINPDPSLREWFKSLHNKYGTSCCDFADGNRLEDPDWRQDENDENGEPAYSVLLFNHWWKVDSNKVLKGTNRIGYAILWKPNVIWNEGDANPPPIYCFIPGQRT